VFKSGNSECEMISIKEGCHPELVEGSRAEALPAMLRQAQHDPFLIMSWLGTKDDRPGIVMFLVSSEWRAENSFRLLCRKEQKG